MSLKAALDRSNPNTLPDAFRSIKLGQTLRQDLKQTLRRKNPSANGTSVSDDATVHTVPLADDAKASTVLRAYARLGAAGTGEMTIKVAPAIPTMSGEIGVSPAGNIVTLAADAITDLDVEFIAMRGDVVEFDAPVVTNAIAIPAAMLARGVVDMLAAKALTGGVVGDKIIQTSSGSAASAASSRLDLAKANIKFAPGDAVTTAHVKLVLAAAADLDGLLEGSSPDLV